MDRRRKEGCREVEGYMEVLVHTEVEMSDCCSSWNPDNPHQNGDHQNHGGDHHDQDSSEGMVAYL